MGANDKERIRICVLGASFDTGNLGVNALAESTIKILLHRWPDAEIVLLGSGYTPARLTREIGGRAVTLSTLPIRLCKNILLPYHLFWFLLYGSLARLLPGARAKTWLRTRNPYCRIVHESVLAVDITGGDSFSDIYGMARFWTGFVRKCVVILFGKRFVMLPQTYGPFSRRTSRMAARYILRHAEAVYSRDQEGLECAKGLLNGQATAKVRFSPDVAFVLDPRPPEDLAIRPHAELRKHGSVVVGLNVSGLLYNGGYSRDNMFALTVDYRRLVRKVARSLLEHDEVVVLLVPHVFTPRDTDVENDPAACRDLFDEISREHPDRVFLAAGRYDQNQIKHLIGLCDFFLGSRMHACIAALSQGVPAVGLAYSQKFRGVFDSVGMASWAIGLRDNDEDAVLRAIAGAFGDRGTASETLRRTVPAVQRHVLGMFEHV